MFRTLSLSLLLACSCGLANAQEIPEIPVDDGGVSGTLTRFAGESQAGGPVDIFTVPEGSTLLITAACLFGTSPILTSTAPSEFVIAQGAGCVNYSPGLITIEGETLVCGGPGSCLGTGILVEDPGE
jgi:hypothetical protein